MYGIRLSNGDVLYADVIFETADRYAETLPPDRDLTEPETFSGLISYLHTELFRAERRPDLDDIRGLDEVWACYAALCGRARQVPTMIEFCTLVGLSRETVRLWERGELRGGDAERVGTIKKWKLSAESALARKAVASSSVGAIFALKSCYSWRDNPPEEQPEQIIKRDSIQEIMARHQGAALPPKLDLSEYED